MDGREVGNFSPNPLAGFKKLDLKKPHYSADVKKKASTALLERFLQRLEHWLCCMSVLCLHYGKVKIWPTLGFQYYSRLQYGHAQESLGSFAGKFLEDAALAWPCCQCVGRPSAWD